MGDPVLSPLDLSDTISVSLQKEKARLKELAEPLLCSMLAMFSGERVLGGQQLGRGRPGGDPGPAGAGASQAGGQPGRPFCPVLKNA